MPDDELAGEPGAGRRQLGVAAGHAFQEIRRRQAAEIGPRLVLREAAATAVRSTGLYRVHAVLENSGYLPTNITERAIEAGLIEPVYATIEVRDAELVSGARRASLGHLPGVRDEGGQGLGETRRSVEYG